jgi:AraC-like DNA-binding protein
MKSMLGVPPVLELIEPSFNQSFTFRKFEEPEPNLKPFWHYHPEIELVYVKSGSAKRHIGNHISEYKNGDLILLGPNLPHYGFTERLMGRRSEIVVQMKSDFLGQEFFSIPEMKEIQILLRKAAAGIIFHDKTKQEVGGLLESLSESDPFTKLMGIITVFRKLALSGDFELLNTNNPTLVLRKQDNDKIDRIYNYVKDHFKDDIRLEDISKLVAMEIPSFCRYFKRVTGKTFTEFVNEFRVTHACKLISETDMSIAAICFESGFNNSSHFNRLFKNTTGKTPLEYRDEVAHLILV